jgi:hypothetical protein
MWNYPLKINFIKRQYYKSIQLQLEDAFARRNYIYASFICGAFNDDLSTSDDMASDAWSINESEGCKFTIIVCVRFSTGIYLEVYKFVTTVF